MLVLLGASSYMGILFRKDADDASGNLVMNDGLVVFPDNVDTKLL